jgi:hypothetical protein
LQFRINYLNEKMYWFRINIISYIFYLTNHLIDASILKCYLPIPKGYSMLEYDIRLFLLQWTIYFNGTITTKLRIYQCSKCNC